VYALLTSNLIKPATWRVVVAKRCCSCCLNMHKPR